MKKILLFLIVLVSFKAQSQTVSYGRIWFGAKPPALKPNQFSLTDRWRDTTTQILYGYKSGWYIPTDQLEGKDGLNGVNGIDGKDGICPACPPSGGVMDFGKIRFVKNWTELNSALTSANQGQVRAIYLTDDITQTSKFRLAENYARQLIIQGNGFYWNIPANIDTGITRTYTSLTAGNQGIDCQLRFENIIFKGSNNIGIYMEANYGSSFIGCNFYNFNKAMDLRWCMGTVIDLCYYWENYIAINLDYATFSGGSNSASQSNHCIITNCKFRASPGDLTMIRVNGASGSVIYHNIFEGGNTQHLGSDYAIYFDDNGSSVVKETTMYGNHVEFIPAKAAIFLKLKDGIADVGGIFSQYDCTLIRFETSAYAKLILKNIPFITGGTKLESVGNGARWNFENNAPNLEAFEATRWTSGLIPSQTTQSSWSTAGQAYNITMTGNITINGKKVVTQ